MSRLVALWRWVLAHRSLVASSGSGAVIVAVVAATALTSGGYTAQQVRLDDGAVWVVNDTDQAVGRANVQVHELNSVVAAKGGRLSVVQDGGDVLLVDANDSTMAKLDPATSTTDQPIPLPPQEPQVSFAGREVVLFEQGTGRVWMVPFTDLRSFDLASGPALSLGAGAVTSVADDGTMFAYSPELGTVSRIDASNGGAVLASSSAATRGTPSDAYSVTSVGRDWAVYDATTKRLATAGRSIDLAQVVRGGAVLQRASSAGSAVLIADDAGLVRVPLDGGAPERIAEASGAAAAPVQLDGCAFAAWDGGRAWRSCGTGSPTTLQLQGVSGGAPLAFAVNGDHLVLNDTRSGAAWAVQGAGELIDNWRDLLQRQDTTQEVQTDDQDTPPVLDPTEQPPVAVDDDFGARPGRTSPLPVLLNDYDPNGDVLVITDVGQLDRSIGTVDLVDDDQQLQLTLSADATGSFSLPYTISDGRGGTATANVRVTVRAPGENSAPTQVRTTRTSVASGAQVSTQVLGDFVDPDGDPVYVTGASVPAPDRVTYQSDGIITFSDAGQGGELKDVSVEVSDGRAIGTGTLAITVKPPGEVPIIADPFVVLASSGVPVTVKPLDHVRGGTGTVKLNGVPAKTGVTVVPSFEDGTFAFTSDVLGTHYLDYVVTDGQQTATGQIRVEVSKPPEPNTKPITVPKTVFVETQSSRTVDVAGSDIDPAGGVLVVTGVDSLPADGSIRADVIAQRDVRVTLDAPLADGTASFTYRVSNGLAEATGTITVIEVPPPVRLQPPVAVPDDVTVRAGDAVDIPVLDNDVQPDGEQLTLQPQLVSGVGSGGGLLFVSGDRLRYLAPTTVGDYTAVYAVAGPDGQTASAPVRISVREPDAATNSAPVPASVTARVLAGGTVRIQIPLTGIDPDGDSVQLVGPDQAPELGSVSDVGPDYLDYDAGSYSAGTDTFTYTVVDGLGARATGTIRVGVAPRSDAVRNPVAVEDAVTVRPGRTVSIQVLANDSDPDGSKLTVTGVTANDPASGIKSQIDGDLVRVTPPTTPGVYGLVYTIADASGGTASNFISVTVDPAAPLSRPVAADTTLALSDVLDRSSVDVDVLKNVFFADGDVRSLRVSLLRGDEDGATVLQDGRIRVKVGDESQIIPFEVAHPDDASVAAYAFIRIPGFKDALPQVNRRAPPLKVVSEGTLSIDINDYVDAAGGGGVRITDSATVRATHSDGSPLVVGPTTLKFTSANLYFGPASISFEVTDGASATSPGARTATIVLPIDVTPRTNQPPVFQGGSLSFEPGEQRQLDLVRLTDYPYPDDLDELAYSIAGNVPAGFSAQVNGQRIVITADQDAAKGRTASIPIAVKDATQAGTGARLQLQVVSSTRPLAKPGADTAVTKRGGTTSIDVLANDQATNPFPETPLRVIAIRGLDGSTLPAGVQVSPSGDNSRLAVSVSSQAQPVNTTLQYEVADATNDPDRYVWGSITIQVEDVPDAPSTPQLTAIGDRTITMRWNAAAANNSTLQNYVATVTNADGSGSRTITCPTTTCQLPTDGNGPSKRVRVSVVAVNGVGSSAAATSDAVWSDVVPDAPTGITAAVANGRILLDWDAPSTNGGSGATYYVVAYNGATQTVTTTSAALSGLTNGQTYSITVSARNGAYNPAGLWNASAPITATPYGPPRAADPSAAIAPGGQGAVTVTWGTSDPNGGGAVSYSVARFTGTATAPSCTPTNRPGVLASDVKSGWTDTTAQDGATYTYVVYAANDRYCTSDAADPVTALRPPGPASGQVAVQWSGNGLYDLYVSGTPSASGTSAKYQASTDDGATWSDASASSRITGSDASAYGTSVQVLFRGCRTGDQSLCGPAGDAVGAVPVNTRVPSLVQGCVAGSPLQPAAPANGSAVDSVAYQVAYGSGAGGLVLYGSFQPLDSSSSVPAGTSGVRVRATVNVPGQAGYTDRSYAQFDCDPGQ